jgi:hypothetical protein
MRRRFLDKEVARILFRRFKDWDHCEIGFATYAPLGTIKTRLELNLQKLTHANQSLRHKV